MAKCKTISAKTKAKTIPESIKLIRDLQAQKASIESEIETAREALTAQMNSAGKTEFSCTDGNARLTEVATYKFDVEKLKKVLTPRQFDELCPRSPHTKHLRELMEADPKQRKRLNACASKETNTRLVVAEPTE